MSLSSVKHFLAPNERVSRRARLCPMKLRAIFSRWHGTGSPKDSVGAFGSRNPLKGLGLHLCLPNGISEKRLL